MISKETWIKILDEYDKGLSLPSNIVTYPFICSLSHTFSPLWDSENSEEILTLAMKYDYSSVNKKLLTLDRDHRGLDKLFGRGIYTSRDTAIRTRRGFLLFCINSSISENNP